MIEKKVLDNIIGKPTLEEKDVKAVIGKTDFKTTRVKPLVGIKKPKDDFWSRNCKD